jgi:uncharacterized protein YprB with RNaseH-like and TPR domain
MNLDQKLRQLRQASRPRDHDAELERTLEYFRRLEKPPEPRKLPAQRAPKGIEEYVVGEVVKNDWGEFFLARESFPFGRPYGRLRVGDFATADFSPLKLFLEDCLPEASRLVFLDTETTGLAGGTGTCAFLIGIGAVEGLKFTVRQYFLRDYPDEKAVLAALTQDLDAYDGIVTYNGKTFDLPLLETRYALARMKSPFNRLVHLDALHPARRLWKLRLESCKLTDLEKRVLGISREGDVPGSEIPAIYFDYLRSGDARGLQPVFYHNALDVVTLAALTVQLAQAVSQSGIETLESSLDLFSLSRIFGSAGARDQSVATCQAALARGLPQLVEIRALQHLGLQLKRQRQYELAVEVWLELLQRESPLAIEAYEELAIYYEHRRRDTRRALDFTLAALERIQEQTPPPDRFAQFTRRLQRLRRKLAQANNQPHLPPS